MPRYSVIITRDVTESTDAEWETDEGSWNKGDAYVTGVDELR